LIHTDAWSVKAHNLKFIRARDHRVDTAG
jgi:hypothetical protein